MKRATKKAQKFLPMVTLCLLGSSAIAAASPYVVMGYYSDWTVYNTQLRHGSTESCNGVPAPYGLTGIQYQAGPGGAICKMNKNSDADAQIPLLNIISYAFAEVYPSYSVQYVAENGSWKPLNQSSYQPSNVGKVYLSDPWSDLTNNSGDTNSLCPDNSLFSSADPYTHEICLGGYETVINGATGMPTKTGQVITSSQYNSNKGWWFLSGNLDKFADLNKVNPNVKRLLSIGGWYHEDAFEAGAFVNHTNFIESLKKVMDHYNLDGIDLDYEPGFYNTQGYTPQNGDKFLSLVQDLRAAFPGKIISFPISAAPHEIDAIAGTDGKNWSKLASLVDYVSVMGYDLHGAFDKQGDPTGAITDFSSNLYDNSKAKNDPVGNFSADTAVNMLLQYQVPANKIILGVPSYARAVQGVTNANDGLYQSYNNPSFLGDMDTSEDVRHAPQGQQSYYGIMRDEAGTKSWINNGFTPHSLADNSAAWIFNPKSGTLNGQSVAATFASYDTAVVMKTKAEYVKNKKLAGMMMWELSSDTSPTETSTSLLCAMADVLNGTCKSTAK